MRPSLFAVPATLATMVAVAVVAVSLPGHGRLPTVYADSPPTLHASQHNAGPSARPAAVVEARLAMADDKDKLFDAPSSNGGTPPAKDESGARSTAGRTDRDRSQRSASVQALPGCLVISQTWRAHEEMMNLLELLSEHSAAQ